jgi:CubicO group peptidase (beta-lactamase class C family)
MESKTPAKQSGVEQQARERFEQLDIPGMSVAVVDGTETVFAAGFGNRQLDPERPATAGTLYGIGSSTKPLTATAVLTLVDSGAIALDDPVSSYVPYFEDAPGDPITVHELLSHTSGMPSDDVATVLILEALGMETDVSLDDWASFRAHVNDSVDRRRLDGDHCLYYNSGYIVLSRLVEAVTDTPFTEFVTERVLDPLGMDDSTFDAGVLADDSRDAMTPYFEREDTMQAASLPDSPLFAAPGGLQASVTDLSNVLSAWTSGDLPIDDDLAALMCDPVGTYGQFVGGTEHGYGYGWMTRPFGDDLLVGHGGGTGVSAGYLGFLRERGLGVAIGCNAQPSTSPAEVAIELLAAMTDTDPVSVLPGRAIQRKVERVTGEYEAYGGIQWATVRWTGEQLEVEHRSPMGGDTERLSPVSLDPTDYRFRAVEGDGSVVTAEFSVDDGVELLLDRVLFERVDDLDDDERE